MNDSSFFAKLLTRVAILNAHQGQICFADLVGREGFAYYTQTELRCVGSPRSLSAGPSGLTAYSSLLGRRSLASNPLNLVGREGFEPSKATPADLQSAAIDHSATYPLFCSWSRR